MGAPETASRRVHELLDRLCRLHAAESRFEDLNPSQVAALGYLARANRFSRAPSQVADYLSATRGTVSQTLKALARKGYIEETRSQTDRRSIAYSATAAGAAAWARAAAGEADLNRLSAGEAAAVASALETLLRTLLAARGGRSFGLCRTCRHHRADPAGNAGARCALLDIRLEEAERDEICYEHEPAR